MSAAVVVLVVFASGVATSGEPRVSSSEGLATINVLDWSDKVAATVSVSEEAETDVVGLLEQMVRGGAAPDLTGSSVDRVGADGTIRVSAT